MSLINICKEFEENYLVVDEDTIEIRIRKVFYADFVDIMRRKGARLTGMTDKWYYVFLDFEWSGEREAVGAEPVLTNEG